MKNKLPFEPDSPSMSFATRLFWVIAFFGPAAYYGYHGDYLLAAVLIGGGFGAFTGFRIGLWAMLTTWAGITAACVYAPQLGMRYETKVSEILGTTGLINRCISVTCVGIFLSLAVWIISRLTIGRVVKSRPDWSRLNHRGGFAIGYAQGVAGLWVLVGGLLVLEPLMRQNLAETDAGDDDTSLVQRVVFGVTSSTDESLLGPLLRDFNPAKKIPQLSHFQDVQRTAAVLSHPASINQVMSHPAIQRLQSEPSVQRAVAQLHDDQSIQQILRSEQPLDRSAAMTLLKHPAVLNLVDQPGFLEQASKAIQETSLPVR